MSNPIDGDIREINRRTIEEFRAHKGGGPFEGRALLILTTRGRVTGRPHTTPMMYVIEGDHLLVMASAAGAPEDPEWYRNLLKTPEVTVEVGDQVYIATARPTEGPEYDALWSQIKKNYPFFSEHEKAAGRKIPVVALERT
ncbi:nitroreductase/quinone reductase family protein [Herbidospora cretacea]|uniref:nitroreductase/quinone reductase family protein n=1 Tax=Herbidospora cretacea TaxID=28444 RepID=UPI0004C3EA5B|nr:nitroreductase/quinone reductase family protein [Herbidospora cretacea]